MTQMKTIFSVNGDVAEVYSIDARSAVENHPEEWSLTPWSPEQKKSYEQQKRDQEREAARQRSADATDTVNGRVTKVLGATHFS